MSWFGKWFGGASGGTTQPSSPALAILTTPKSIRDRIIALIEALTPDAATGDRFHAFRNDRDGAFQKWALANAAGCRRRFEVRRIDDIGGAAVSNSDYEELMCTFRVQISYPQTNRDGEFGALGRDDTIDQDVFKIDKAIGMNGRANFAPPYPDACWRDEGNGERSRIGATLELDGIDIAEIYVSYSYLRDRR